VGSSSKKKKLIKNDEGHGDVKVKTKKKKKRKE
jgi:hypothetical protein